MVNQDFGRPSDLWIAEVAAALSNGLQVAKRKKVKIEIIEETEEGDLSIGHLQRLVEAEPQKPALIAITHVPTNSGKHLVSVCSIHTLLQP